MRADMVSMLACPDCKSRLIPRIDKMIVREINKGVLSCKSCNEEYPLINGIANLLPPAVRRVREDDSGDKAMLQKAGAAEVNEKYVTHLNELYGNEQRFNNRQEIYASFSVPALDVFTWMTEHAKLSTNECVLDIGCGPGLFFSALAPHGVRIIGIDQSWAMTETARRQAEICEIPGAMLAGMAEALPIQSGCVNVVMANNMLYHLGSDASRIEALKEMKRVIASGGRIVMATNGKNHLQRLRELHQRAAEATGYEATTEGFDRFTLGDLDLVKTVFPEAETRIQEGYLVLPDLDALVRAYRAIMIDLLRDRPADDSHREPLLEWVKAEGQQIIEREGEFRDFKPTGCFAVSV